MKIDEKVQARFWKKVKKQKGSNACWLWQANQTTGGYGHFKMNGKAQKAHRVAWTFENGEVPPGLLLMHQCDNARCVRPSHLKLGTTSKNMREMVERKRHWNGATGEDHNPVTRFYRRVTKLEGEDACWIWTTNAKIGGFGTFFMNGQTYKAHRAAWILEHGSIPARMYLLHQCDNSSCVRVSHLKLGTIKENVYEMVSRGRGNQKQSITEEMVQIIRARFVKGDSPLTISQEMKLDRSSVWRIVTGRTWAHVEGGAEARAVSELPVGTSFQARGSHRGEKNSQAVVTENLVRQLRTEYVPHRGAVTELARKFNLKPVTVHAIVSGRNWSHVA